MFRLENSSLLISCCNQNGGLYLIEFANNKAWLSKILSGDCRGLARYKDKYILNTTDQGILLLDRYFNKVKQKVIYNRLDFHGLAVHDDKAYIIETRKNRIGIYDLAGLKRIGQLQFSAGSSDIFHLNDLFITGDKLYISMFSYTDPWRNLANNALSAGVILKCSLEKRMVIGPLYKNLSHPHSILIRDGQFFYCNSAGFEVKRNNRVIFKTAGYARGLAIKHEFIFVGRSNNRRLAGQECGFYVFNVIAAKAKFFKLPSQEVYGILVI